MGTVTVINTTPYKLQPVPEVGKEYHIFDDGKIKPCRHYKIIISKLIPFAEASEELLGFWKQEVEECDWLYAEETDYFVETEFKGELMHFVRTVDGGWFSMGFWGSRLDMDGSLYEKMKEYYNVED